MTDEVIHFTASVAQVRTMADGGIRLVLDLPETAIDTAADMMKAKQAGAVLECAVVAVVKQVSIKDDIQTRTERKSEWKTQERPGANSPA
jgi:hypothetical protein